MNLLFGDIVQSSFTSLYNGFVDVHNVLYRTVLMYGIKIKQELILSVNYVNGQF